MRKWISASLGLVFLFTLVFSFVLSLTPAPANATWNCCRKGVWCNDVYSEALGHFGVKGDCVIDGSHVCDQLCGIN
jgi:hypothetical protein